MIVECRQCHKPFSNTHWNQFICSNRCKQDRKNAVNLKLNQKNRGYEGYPSKNCIICLGIFKSNNSNQNVCSNKCKVIRERIRKNEQQKKYHSKRKNDLSYIICRILRNSLNKTIERKTIPSSQYMTFSVQEFRAHFEKKFSAGMSWENWGEWHVDHIRPLSSFNLVDMNGNESLDEILKANSLSNLQPLWAYENLRKHNKYDR